MPSCQQESFASVAGVHIHPEGAGKLLRARGPRGDAVSDVQNTVCTQTRAGGRAFRLHADCT